MMVHKLLMKWALESSTLIGSMGEIHREMLGTMRAPISLHWLGCVSMASSYDLNI